MHAALSRATLLEQPNHNPYLSSPHARPVTRGLHECLLEKLRIYQCDDNSSKWFRSYLTGRTQQTAIKGHLSETAVITAGVPQGSILGPLLFILYMNDLPLHIDNNIDMFADDSTLYTSGHNVDEIQRSLQNNLNAITTWCEDNRMVLNVAKTKCMLITTKQRRHHLRNNQLAITLNDQDLQQVTQHKVIGVVVDENLQWREHVNAYSRRYFKLWRCFVASNISCPNGQR